MSVGKRDEIKPGDRFDVVRLCNADIHRFLTEEFVFDFLENNVADRDVTFLYALCVV